MVNTSDYKLNIFGSTLVVCSNDSLHKYQIDKITVQSYEMPVPESNLNQSEIIPVLSLGKDVNTTDFIMIFREEQTDLDKRFDQV